MIFHGLVGVIKPPESYSLDLDFNEKKFSWKIPLRHVLGATVNTVIGLAGVISIVPIVHYQWWYSTWGILGLILSSLLLLWVLISFLMMYSKQRSDMQLQSPISPKEEALEKPVKVLQKSVEYLETSCGEYLGNLVQLFNFLLPLPSISSVINENFSQALKQQREITPKPVHILLILLSMFICVLVFSMQLWFVSTTCNLFYDCKVDGYFARTWDSFYMTRIEDRILIILISTPVTFLLSTMLLVLMKKTNVMRMLLIIIISLVLGIFFLVFSFATVQYIILMGKMPLLPKVLTLASLLPVPLLAVIFLALAYTNIVQLKQEKEREKSSNSRICLLSVSIFLSILLVLLSLTTMTMSNLTISSAMQKNWNSTRDHSYDRECREEEHYYDSYGYELFVTTTTTTVSPSEKPEKCYGKTLDHQVQDRMTFFSISQLTVSETLLFFSLVVILTGRRLTKKHLFIPGILLFASATSTSIAFFTRLDPNFEGYENSNLFFIMNCVTTFGAFLIGFSCFVIGSSAFISFLELVFRLIFSSIVFTFIILFSLVQSFLKLASRLGSMKMTIMKRNEENVVI